MRDTSRWMGPSHFFAIGIRSPHAHFMVLLFRFAKSQLYVERSCVDEDCIVGPKKEKDSVTSSSCSHEHGAIYCFFQDQGSSLGALATTIAVGAALALGYLQTEESRRLSLDQINSIQKQIDLASLQDSNHRIDLVMNVLMSVDIVAVRCQRSGLSLHARPP